MRSHRRRQPVEHVLIAGDINDLASIQAVLNDLAPTTYGQVFIETGGHADVPVLATPARVSVHLIGASSAPSTTPTLLAARGTALADAVETWVGEWLPTGLDSTAPLLVWIGGRASDEMTRLYRALPVLAQRL